MENRQDIETGLLENQETVRGCAVPEWCGIAMAMWNIVFIVALMIAVILSVLWFQGVL